MFRRKWTAEEIQLLASLYPEHGLSRLLDLLQRSKPSISSMANRLGLRSHNHYTHQALSRLQRLVGRVDGAATVHAQASAPASAATGEP